MSLARKMAISLIASALLLAVVVYLVGARATLQAVGQVGLPAFFTIGATLYILMACQAAAWAALERNPALRRMSTDGSLAGDGILQGTADKKLAHRVSYRTLLEAVIVAMAGNILTPSTHLGGEPGKIIYARRKTALPYTELAGTVLLCKYIEAMSFVLFATVGAVFALAGFGRTLFRPPQVYLGVAIIVLTVAALVMAVVLWVSLMRKWTPLSAIVAFAGRLGIRKTFFENLHERALRMELHASGMFRTEGGAVLPAFAWYVLTHLAMFFRPMLFFWLGWQIHLSLAELGLIFLTSQVLLTVQLMPSGIGTLDGGLLAVVAAAGMGISVPQCTAFLLCIRFWDAAVVATGALLAARAGVGLFRNVR